MVGGGGGGGGGGWGWNFWVGFAARVSKFIKSYRDSPYLARGLQPPSTLFSSLLSLFSPLFWLVLLSFYGSARTVNSYLE